MKIRIGLFLLLASSAVWFSSSHSMVSAQLGDRVIEPISKRRITKVSIQGIETEISVMKSISLVGQKKSNWLPNDEYFFSEFVFRVNDL